MYARLRARWGRRPAIAALATALVLVLGACDTQPATDVGSTAATLNAKGGCVGGTSGWWRYQIRDASAGQAFYGVGPQHDFSCGQNGAEVALPSHRATGLASGRLYQFRIRTQLSNGQALTFDSNGTSGGTAYDSFTTTRLIRGDEGNDPPETCFRETMTSACASGPAAAGRGCKWDLKNTATLWQDIPAQSGGTLLMAYARVEVDWCYTGAGNGSYIQAWLSKMVTDITDAGFAYGWRRAAGQHVSTTCSHDQKPFTCLIRYKQKFTHPLERDETACIGTRIYGQGSHNRAVHWNDDCPF